MVNEISESNAYPESGDVTFRLKTTFMIVTTLTFLVVILLIALIPLIQKFKSPSDVASYLGVIITFGVIWIMLLPSLLNAGIISVDERGLSLDGRFAHVAIKWNEIVAVKNYGATTIFYGTAGKLMVVTHPRNWEGKENRKAVQYMETMLIKQDIRFVNSPSPFAPKFLSRSAETLSV